MPQIMEKEPLETLGNTLKEFDIKNYFRIIRGRIPLLLFIVVSVVIVVGIKSFTMTPIYSANTEILIEQKTPSSLFDRETSSYRIDPTFLPTQYEIIKSNGVIEKTIEELKLDTKFKSHFLGGDDQGNKILRSTKKYISDAKTKVKSFIKDLIKKDSQRIELSGNDNTTDNTKKEITDHLVENLSIIPITDTKLVRFVYRDKDPDMAAHIANTLVDSYKNELMEIKLDESNYSLQWMKIKAEEERKKLDSLENKKQKYAREHDILTLENRLTVLPEKLEEYNVRLTEAESRLHQLQEINKLLQTGEGKLTNMESIPLISNNPVIQNIQNQLVNLDRELAELSKKYGRKHPRMREKMNEKNSIVQEKKREIIRLTQSSKQEYALAKETVNNIHVLFQKTKGEAQLLNEKLSDYERMNRELATGRTLYDALIKNMKEASARNQEKEVNVWVTNKAISPKYPFKPNKKINLALALILGTAGGIGFVFLLEHLDDTIKSPEEIERFNTPVLGIVEKMPDKASEKDMILRDGSFSTFAESYKIIRSSVMLSSPGSPAKIILITSTEPGDGKTTTTINFARSLAMLEDSKVLVIDCDLRKPRLHKRLNIKSNWKENLSAYLAGLTPSIDTIISKKYGQPFDVIPAGTPPPNPSELLASAKMKSLLPALKTKYDFIVLDSPPLFGAIDGLNLSTLVDGTILVVRGEKTTRNLYGKVLKRLRSVNARILGTIINGMPIRKENIYNYAGYYASYGEYSDKLPEEKKGRRKKS